MNRSLDYNQEGTFSYCKSKNVSRDFVVGELDSGLQ